MKVVKGHLVLTGSDRGLFRIPEKIKDRNSDIALDMCVICGKAESELEGSCEPKHSAAPFTVGPDGWADCHIDINAQNHQAIAQVLTGMEDACFNTFKKQEELNANAYLFASSPFLYRTLVDLFIYVDNLKGLELNKLAAEAVCDHIQNRIRNAISFAVSGKLP